MTRKSCVQGSNPPASIRPLFRPSPWSWSVAAGFPVAAAVGQEVRRGKHHLPSDRWMGFVRRDARAIPACRRIARHGCTESELVRVSQLIPQARSLRFSFSPQALSGEIRWSRDASSERKSDAAREARTALNWRRRLSGKGHDAGIRRRASESGRRSGVTPVSSLSPSSEALHPDACADESCVRSRRSRRNALAVRSRKPGDLTGHPPSDGPVCPREICDNSWLAGCAGVFGRPRRSLVSVNVASPMELGPEER